MINTLLTDFLDAEAAEKGVALNTLKAYQNDIEQFAGFIGKSPEQANAADISTFVEDLNRRGFAVKSVSRKISALKEFYKFLLSENIIKENPAATVMRPKAEKPLPKFLTIEEIRQLIIAAEANPQFPRRRLAVMLKLMYAYGLRVSELVTLTENSVNLKKGQIFVKGKGSKERVIPVAAAAIEAVAAYLPIRKAFLGKRQSPWLFCSEQAIDGHLTRDAFYKLLKKVAAEAGISPQRVSPHVLRHSFATHLLGKNVDLRSLQKMLGHENIGTTEIYTHIVSPALVKTVQTKHPLANIKI